MKRTDIIRIPILVLIVLAGFISCKRPASKNSGGVNNPLDNQGAGEMVPAVSGTASIKGQENLQNVDALQVRLGARNPSYVPNAKHRSKFTVRNGKIVGVNLSRTNVQDLSPLTGLPLESINLSKSDVKDITPLKGMPLRVVHIDATNVVNFSPLAGLPLTELHVNDTCFQDNDMILLKDMPLETLFIGNTAVKDLSLLKAMPLSPVTSKCTTCDHFKVHHCGWGFV